VDTGTYMFADSVAPVALAIEHGCELITTDSDFARFSGLRWRHPFAA
jgi:predicted nucleic acid-binding protein